MMTKPVQYLIEGDDLFPGSILPVLYYEQAVSIPALFPAKKIKLKLQQNNWGNNWRDGIYKYCHYHSNTHEVLIVVAGRTIILLGGIHGTGIFLRKGDMVIIPAGVAHKNLGGEHDVTCIGGYPDGREYNMNYGSKDERQAAEEEIKTLPLPETGPLFGREDPMMDIWRSSQLVHHRM